MKKKYNEMKSMLIRLVKKEEVVKMMIKKGINKGKYPVEFLPYLEEELAITRRARKQRSNKIEREKRAAKKATTML